MSRTLDLKEAHASLPLSEQQVKQALRNRLDTLRK
jgi:hypothetical protein